MPKILNCNFKNIKLQRKRTRKRQKHRTPETGVEALLAWSNSSSGQKQGQTFIKIALQLWLLAAESLCLISLTRLNAKAALVQRKHIQLKH